MNKRRGGIRALAVLAAMAPLAAITAFVATPPAFAAWTDPKTIGEAPKILGYIPERPAQIAVSGSVVHVVWFTDFTDRQALRYARSKDCGDTWSKPTSLVEIPFRERSGTFVEVSNDVALTVSGNSIHVFWFEERKIGSYRTSTFHIRSLNGGATWSGPQQLSPSNQVGEFSPLLAASDGTEVFAVWRANWRGRHRIIVAWSGNDGESWSFQTPGPIAAREESWPALALDPGSFGQIPQAYVSFAKYPERRKKIFHRTTLDGASWIDASRPLRTKTPKPGMYHDGDLVWPITVLPQSNSLDVVWGHGVAFKYGYITHDLYFQRSTDDGWSKKVRINRKKGDAWYPAVAAAGRRVNVAWIGAISEVWFARSSDRGATWDRRRLLRKPHDGGQYVTVALAANPHGVGRCSNTTHAVYGGQFAPVEDGLELTYRRSPTKLP